LVIIWITKDDGKITHSYKRQVRKSFGKILIRYFYKNRNYPLTVHEELKIHGVFVEILFFEKCVWFFIKFILFEPLCYQIQPLKSLPVILEKSHSVRQVEMRKFSISSSPIKAFHFVQLAL